MKKALLGFGLMILAASLYAQESLVGTYNGTFNWQTQSRGVMALPISLKITSAAGGKLQATACRGHNNKAGANCAGEYKLSGTYEGNKLDLKPTSDGAPNDCGMHLQLVAEGRKLKGTIGKSDVEMYK